MKIAFLALGSSKDGMGHIMRTSVLARKLSEKHQVFYHTKKENEYAKGAELIEKLGFESVCIKKLSDCFSCEADFFIMDCYEANQAFYEKAASRFRNTMIFDDNNKESFYPANILFNQNIGAETFNYQTNADTKKLLGAQYILLRDEFRAAKPIEAQKQVTDVLLTTGGSDFHNVTGQMLGYLQNEQSDIHFHVVITDDFPNQNEIIKTADKNKNFHLCKSPQMAELMSRCQVAVTALGSTVYELSALGIPFLGVITAENQVNLAQNLSVSGLMPEAHWYYNSSKEKFLDEFNRFRNDFAGRKEVSEKQLQTVDRNGVDKVCELIENMLR